MNHVQSPATGDTAIEQEIQAKGKTAPRVTPADLQANIVAEHYFTAADGVEGGIVAGYKYPGPLDLLTFCVLVLANGFTVTGESACASPENFDAEIGRKIARENAVQKIWPLMGYALKCELSRPAQPEPYLFGMRQVVHTPTGLGTVIGRTESAAGEPTYLVRDFESESLTEGKTYSQADLRAF